MKILMLVRSCEGGIRAHIVSLVKGLQSRGHSVSVLTDLTTADETFRLLVANDPAFSKTVSHLKMKSAPGPADLITLVQLKRFLRDQNFDVIHGHGAKGGVFARLLKAWGFVPGTTRVVYTPHGGSLHAMHGSIKNRLYAWIERKLASHTDLLLFESRYSQSRFQEAVGAAVSSRLNRNGIGLTQPADLSKWPSGLGRDSVLRIGAFGLLRSIKGFDTLIRSAALLHRRGVNAKFEIFGEGEERHALDSLITNLQLQSYVELKGPTTKPEAEMLRQHIVVQPSHFESFGLVSLEAQALGCLAIASEVGGLPEIIEDGKTGYLFEPKNEQALADLIEKALNSPEQVETMRRQAAERAKTEFSAEQMINGALAAYGG